MADYYVNVASGDDSESNPGTNPTAPLQTITEATMRAAADTGTIHVADGVYSAASGEAFPLHIPTTYDLHGAGRDRTIIRFTGESTIPERGGTVPYWGGTAIHAGREVRDLTVEASPALPTFGCSATFGIYVIEDGTRIEGVRVHAPSGVAAEDGFVAGITSGGRTSSRRLTVVDCVIERCRGAAIWDRGDDVVVERCSISDIRGGGFQFPSPGLALGSGSVLDTAISDVMAGMQIDRDARVERCEVRLEETVIDGRRLPGFGWAIAIVGDGTVVDSRLYARRGQKRRSHAACPGDGPNPLTVAPTIRAIDALRQMGDRGFRHLPVVEDGMILVVVSRGDFKGMEIDRLEKYDHLWECLR